MKGEPVFPEYKMSEEAVRVRRNLIVAFSIWLLVVSLGLAPTKIAPLEIDLAKSPFSIPNLISIVLVYFWISFLVYAHQDWIKWYQECQGLRTARLKTLSTLKAQISEIGDQVAHAQNEGKDEDFEIFIDVTQREYTKNRIGHRLGHWETTLSSTKEQLRNAESLSKIVQRDVIGRNIWEYFLPTATIIGPLAFWITAIVAVYSPSP